MASSFMTIRLQAQYPYDYDYNNQEAISSDDDDGQWFTFVGNEPIPRFKSNELSDWDKLCSNDF